MTTSNLHTVQGDTGPEETRVEVLRLAIEKYNSYGYPLFMDTPAFGKLLSARNLAFKKKILLVNLRDAVVNAHLERVFTRAVSEAGVPGGRPALDVVHSFEGNYGLDMGGNTTGFRVKYSGMANLKDFVARTSYAAVIFIDLPYREEEFMPYAWLSLRYKAPEKHFIANDNLMPAGHLFGLDLAQELRLFDAFTTACIVNQHSAGQWARFGRPRKGFLKRDYAMDCRYYDPSCSFDGGYMLSCGMADRDFGPLLEAMGKTGTGMKLKIYTGTAPAVPAGLKRKVEIIPYVQDCARLKQLVAGASFVALPVAGSRLNPGAGLGAAIISMAMGKVVLTLGSPCVKRYLKDGQNAFTYSSLSAPELKKGIKRILSLDIREKARIEAGARAAALRMNDMNPFAESYLNRLALLPRSLKRYPLPPF